MFQEIDEEEIKEAQEESDSEEEEKTKKKSPAQANPKKAPMFGKSQTDYKYVQEFYSYWRNFVSRRSYAFADKYNLNTVYLKENLKKKKRKKINFKYSGT